MRGAGYDGLTIGIETADDEALRFMDKGYLSADILEQCGRLDKAGIRYSFFYLTGISGAGRGEDGARITAAVCNQLHPALVGANMLTIYPDSKLYGEIRQGNWKEETETEKYREVRSLVEGLEIPTEFAALGASNAFQMHGVLPEDKEKLLAFLDDVIKNVGEDELRRYRKSVRRSVGGALWEKGDVLICFAVITMLITGCGEKPAVLPLKLPDAEQITAVKLQP